jgi:hypothetical protein
MPSDAYNRFIASMVIDYEKWHDGIGYDLDALQAVTPAERKELEQKFLARGTRDWRDAEALAVLNTDAAARAMEAALHEGPWEVRLTAASRLMDRGRLDRAAMGRLLVEALPQVALYGGLTKALDLIESLVPPSSELVNALWHGVEHREGEVAFHLAAMLMYLYGLSDGQYDWTHRPFLLRFNTQRMEHRAAAIAELRQMIGDRPLRGA